MGQTLENGVYLPSEGERNCYAGLKTNWEILDQKVADVTALQQAVAGALHREIVESLPTTDIDPNTIYMVLSGTSATENVYNEYMYVNNAWELIGTSATDLTNYYTKGEIDGKLLLKANASDLTSHTGDATIHVTTADKNKWNNQTYVFRYSSTALVASSTNSNALLDNTDNLKVGDKVIDSSGVLFSITAIDTANSTFTIGTALVDLAQDSDVVHKSGNETISGDKVFNSRLIKNIDVVLGTAPSTGKFSNIDIADNNKASLLQIMGGVYDNGQSYARFFVQNKTADDGTGLSPTGTIRGCGFNINFPANSTSEGQGSITPRANKATDFGLLTYQWRNLWCEKLYLNGTQLDPSAFALDNAVVHLSGNETVGGQKTFTNSIILQNSDTSGVSRDLFSKSQVAVLGDVGSSDNTKYRFVDKNNNEICYIRQRKLTNSNTDMSFCVNNIDNDNNSISAEINFIIDKNNDPRISPSLTDFISLGRPTFRWKSIYSNSYYYGNVEFSTKFVTTDTNQTISGNKTFSDNLTIYNSDDTVTPKGLMIRNAQWGMGESGGTTVSNINFLDKNSSVPASVMASKGIYGQSYLRFAVRTKDSQNNTYAEEIYYDIDTSGNVEFRSWHDNTISLGTSVYKWKDVQTNKINGLTPSSLSMPDISSRIDISSYITNLNGTYNAYTPSVDGWIAIQSSDATFIRIADTGSGGLGNTVTSQTAGTLTCMLPVRVNRQNNIYIVCTTLTSAYFIPCQGNV